MNTVGNFVTFIDVLESYMLHSTSLHSWGIYRSAALWWKIRWSFYNPWCKANVLKVLITSIFPRVYLLALGYRLILQWALWFACVFLFSWKLSSITHSAPSSLASPPRGTVKWVTVAPCSLILAFLREALLTSFNLVCFFLEIQEQTLLNGVIWSNLPNRFSWSFFFSLQNEGWETGLMTPRFSSWLTSYSEVPPKKRRLLEGEEKEKRKSLLTCLEMLTLRFLWKF